mmetsp:Transcript_50310/g.56205  ORF Transcript_50310/g.56205 Transcript_50310/m.56205 type:complete len:104 (+) Transcript_50310:148-459(+)
MLLRARIETRGGNTSITLLHLILSVSIISTSKNTVHFRSTGEKRTGYNMKDCTLYSVKNNLHISISNAVLHAKFPRRLFPEIIKFLQTMIPNAFFFPFQGLAI